MSDNEEEEWIDEPRGYWEILIDEYDEGRSTIAKATALVYLLNVVVSISVIVEIYVADLSFVTIPAKPFGMAMSDQQLGILIGVVIGVSLYVVVRSTRIALRDEP